MHIICSRKCQFDAWVTRIFNIVIHHYLSIAFVGNDLYTTVYIPPRQEWVIVQKFYEMSHKCLLHYSGWHNSMTASHKVIFSSNLIVIHVYRYVIPFPHVKEKTFMSKAVVNNGGWFVLCISKWSRAGLSLKVFIVQTFRTFSFAKPGLFHFWLTVPLKNVAAAVQCIPW